MTQDILELVAPQFLPEDLLPAPIIGRFEHRVVSSLALRRDPGRPTPRAHSIQPCACAPTLRVRTRHGLHSIRLASIERATPAPEALLFDRLYVPRDDPVCRSEPGKTFPAEHELVKDAGPDDRRLGVPELMQLRPELRALCLIGFRVELRKETILVRHIPPSGVRSGVDVLQRWIRQEAAPRHEYVPVRRFGAVVEHARPLHDLQIYLEPGVLGLGRR